MFIKKVITRLTEHDDVIKPLLKGFPLQVLHWAPRLLGPACSSAHVDSNDLIDRFHVGLVKTQHQRQT